MLNEERVILMTRMEAYAESEGKKNMQIGRYFRSDYISLQVLKSVISATIVYVLIFGLYILYHLEEFLQDIYKMDLMKVGKNLLLYYVIFTAANGLITYTVYSFRYSRAKRSLKKYYRHQKQLAAINDIEKKNHP